MKIIIAIAFGIAIIATIVMITKAQENQIRAKVASIGGELISFEPRIVNHPFFLVWKGEQAYQFTYSINGQVKEGFVKFSLFTDWRL